MYRITISLVVFATLDAFYCAPLDLTTSYSSLSTLSPDDTKSNEVPGLSADSYDPKAFYSLERFEGDILGQYPEVSDNRD